MKKQLLFMAFIAFFAMAFTACSSSDETQNEQTQLKLSAGITAQREPYDINEWGTNIDIGSIDASAAKESKVKVDKVLTRNTVDNDNWVGMNNRNIAVQAGGSVFQYSVDASGNLTSNSPYYFITTSNVSISSWYPYLASLGTFAVQTDQTSFAKAVFFSRPESFQLPLDGSGCLQILLPFCRYDRLFHFLDTVVETVVGNGKNPVLTDELVQPRKAFNPKVLVKLRRNGRAKDFP